MYEAFGSGCELQDQHLMSQAQADPHRWAS